MNYTEELIQVLTRLDIAPLIAFVEGCQGTLWLAGNGGSAATAQHWACDLSKAAKRRAQALGCNSAVLTAYANDEGYEHALAMELGRLYQPGDSVICISCSGISANLLMLIDLARNLDLPTAMVTGAHTWKPGRETSLLMRVPHDHYGIIEDCHMAIGHWLTEALCSR